jgi:hypothetical protein
MPERDAPEIRALIAASQAESFTDMAAEIAAVVGLDCAPSPKAVAEIHHEIYPPLGLLRRSRFDRRPEVVEFVADRFGLKSLDEIVRLGVEKFGAGNFPSRSGVGRMIMRIARRG